MGIVISKLGSVILVIYGLAFVAFIVLLVVKIRERIKEAKTDKYKDIRQ